MSQAGAYERREVTSNSSELEQGFQNMLIYVWENPPSLQGGWGL